MGRILLYVASALFLASSAGAAETLVFSFNKDLTYQRGPTGRNGGSSVTRPCADFTNVFDAPDSCFTKHYMDLVDAAQAQTMRQNYEAKILSLENQLNTYRDQIATNHRDIIETIIADPQFRSMLAKKLKADAQR